MPKLLNIPAIYFFVVTFILTNLVVFPVLSQSKITINWNQVIGESKTTPTLQVVYNPMLNRNSPIHDGTFKSLKELGADYVRFVPWFPYPHSAVVELKPPTKDSTFWDFSYIDPVMEDLMSATEGHSVIINFSTIPDWMFKTPKLVQYPKDPNQVFWDYNQGTQPNDKTLKEIADYYVRLFSWYTKGGFTDELGKFHQSGFHYKIPYWEVLNEPDFEHSLSPQLYTKIYDEVVTALRKISPDTKFIGLALLSENNPEWFEYFLNPANHKQGIPLDGISYHFYAGPSPQDKTIVGWQYSFFEKADNFLVKVKYIENILKRLSPNTFTDLDELGVINEVEGQTGKNIQDAAYWNLAGAMYAYLYLESAKIGIEVAGESQLVGYPTQFPSVSMMNWTNGKPNARYWVLKLLKDNFGRGDHLVSTDSQTSAITAQGFLTSKGKKLLLINKRDTEITVSLPDGANGKTVEYVDTNTGDNPVGHYNLSGDDITLKPFAVAVVHLNN